MTSTLAPLPDSPEQEWSPTGARPGSLHGPVTSTWTARVSVFLLGLNLAASASLGLTTGLLVSVVLLPVWAGALHHYRGAVPVVLVTVLALLNGVLLLVFSTTHQFDLRNALQVTLQLVTAVGGMGLVLWARRVLPVHEVAMVFGAGATLAALPQVPGSPNPWKYELSIPVALLLLGWVMRPSAGRSALLVPLVLAGIGVLNDHRSFFGFCLGALVLALWQARPVRPGRRAGPAAHLVFLVVGAVAVYQGGTALLLSGALGPGLQARSQAQVREAGSLLVGGRPEPTATDVAVASTGLYSTNVPTLKGYITNFMFNERFKLHSLTSDLWSNFGPAGLGLGLLVFLTVLLTLAVRLAHRTAPVLVGYLALNGLWSMGFEPLYSALFFVAPTLGLVLLPRVRPTGDGFAVPPA